MSRLLQKEGNNKNEEDSRKIRLFRPKSPILEKSASQNSPNKTSGEYLLPQIILSPRERNLQQINRVFEPKPANVFFPAIYISQTAEDFIDTISWLNMITYIILFLLNILSIFLISKYISFSDNNRKDFNNNDHNLYWNMINLIQSYQILKIVAFYCKSNKGSLSKLFQKIIENPLIFSYIKFNDFYNMIEENEFLKGLFPKPYYLEFNGNNSYLAVFPLNFWHLINFVILVILIIIQIFKIVKTAKSNDLIKTTDVNKGIRSIFLTSFIELFVYGCYLLEMNNKYGIFEDQKKNELMYFYSIAIFLYFFVCLFILEIFVPCVVRLINDNRGNFLFG